VSDDGLGFDPAMLVIPSADGRRGGWGLPLMAARAAEAGLQLRVWSAPGAGTRVVIEAPLVEEGDPAGRSKRAVRSAPRQI
jgi:signal transduction histidine kinase